MGKQLEPVVAAKPPGELIRSDEHLGADAVEAIARRMADLLGEELARRHEQAELVDAAELARRLGLQRSWVYAHAEELGGMRLGRGTRPRLRFEPQTAINRLRVVAEAGVGGPPAPQRRRSRSQPVNPGSRLLPIKGGGAS